MRRDRGVREEVRTRSFIARAHLQCAACCYLPPLALKLRSRPTNPFASPPECNTTSPTTGDHHPFLKMAACRAIPTQICRHHTAQSVHSPDSRTHTAALTSTSCFNWNNSRASAALQMRAVLSSDAVTMRSPFGLHCAEFKASVCPRKMTGIPVPSAVQTRFRRRRFRSPYAMSASK